MKKEESQILNILNNADFIHTRENGVEEFMYYLSHDNNEIIKEYLTVKRDGNNFKYSDVSAILSILKKSYCIDYLSGQRYYKIPKPDFDQIKQLFNKLGEGSYERIKTFEQEPEDMEKYTHDKLKYKILNNLSETFRELSKEILIDNLEENQ